MIADFVVETLTSGFTGIGAFALGGAVSNNKRFRDKRSTGAKVYYVAKTLSTNGSRKYEQGEGTLTVSGGGDTLSRDRIDASSNNGSAVDWQASDTTTGQGTVWIYMAPPLDVLAGYVPHYVDVGAGNTTLTANDIGTVFGFNVAAANRTLTMVAGSTLSRFFRFGVYGYGHASNTVAVTPISPDGINGGSAGVALNVTGNTGIKWFNWDPTRSTWLTE